MSKENVKLTKEAEAAMVTKYIAEHPNVFLDLKSFLYIANIFGKTNVHSMYDKVNDVYKTAAIVAMIVSRERGNDETVDESYHISPFMMPFNGILDYGNKKIMITICRNNEFKNTFIINDHIEGDPYKIINADIRDTCVYLSEGYTSGPLFKVYKFDSAQFTDHVRFLRHFSNVNDRDHTIYTDTRKEKIKQMADLFEHILNTISITDLMYIFSIVSP